MKMETLKKTLTAIVTLTSFFMLAVNSGICPFVVPDSVQKWVASAGMLVALFAKSVLGWVIFPTPINGEPPAK
jgi:hypothetical protein